MATEDSKKYEDLVNNLSLGVYRDTSGPKGHFLEANPAMVSMFEADSREEFMLHNVSDFYQDSAKRNLFVEKITKDGFVKNEELNLITLKGRKIVGSVSAVMKKDEKGEIYFDGIIEDITERKRYEELLKKTHEDLEKRVEERTKDLQIEKIKAENSVNDLRKFKLALDNVSDHVTITDEKGITIYANAAVEKITGYKPEEAVGKKAGELWKLPMPHEYYQKLWQTIAQKKEPFIGEIQNRRKNGKIYTAIISISPVLDEQKNVLFFVGLERDITKEKEIDQAKSEFISLASHQLKTPPTIIKLLTERLLDGKMGEFKEEQKEYLIDIQSSNERMIYLINALLNVSRIELGVFYVKLSECDVCTITKSVVDELKIIIDKKKLDVKIISSDKKIMLMLDEPLFRMAINNLVMNSINYTKEKGKVTVECKKVREGEILGERTLKEDCVVVSVSDSGYGIKKEDQDKIFTKFFRADNARESQTDGTGLGLYIVKSILENSGGSIWFTSKENQGSVFYVAIPMTGMTAKPSEKKLII